MAREVRFCMRVDLPIHCPLPGRGHAALMHGAGAKASVPTLQ
jgi:hypothetical protein